MRALKRAARASILDRRAHTELFFDSDATADAVLLVAAIHSVVYVGTSIWSPLVAFSVTNLLSAVIYGLIEWLILAAATWFVATRLFEGSGGIQTLMRLHGHCELPLLLGIVGGYGTIAGLVWSVAAKVVATREGVSLNLVKSFAAVLLGFVLVILIRLILRLPFAAFGGLF